MPIALTTSRRGLVLANVVATLKTMSVVGGYSWTVKPESVQTDPRNPMAIAEDEAPFFMVEPSEPAEREFQPANQLREAYRILITAVVFAEGSDRNRRLATAETMLRDLERLLTRDIFRGGYATDTRALEPEFSVGFGEERRVIVAQPIECAIHRTYGEP